MRSRKIAIILSLTLGFLGAHRVYLRDYKLGLFYFLTFVTIYVDVVLSPFFDDNYSSVLFVFGIGFIVNLIDGGYLIFISKEYFDYRFNHNYEYQKIRESILIALVRGKLDSVKDKRMEFIKDSGLVLQIDKYFNYYLEEEFRIDIDEQYVIQLPPDMDELSGMDFSSSENVWSTILPFLLIALNPLGLISLIFPIRACLLKVRPKYRVIAPRARNSGLYKVTPYLLIFITYIFLKDGSGFFNPVFLMYLFFATQAVKGLIYDSIFLSYLNEDLLIEHKISGILQNPISDFTSLVAYLTTDHDYISTERALLNMVIIEYLQPYLPVHLQEKGNLIKRFYEKNFNMMKLDQGKYEKLTLAFFQKRVAQSISIDLSSIKYHFQISHIDER
ncbi:MAG: TM2 domain-containing protein [Saprospiraceae bacterium]